MGEKWKLRSGKMVKTPKAKSGYVIASSAKSAKSKWCKRFKMSNKCKARKHTTRKGTRRYRKDSNGKSCRGRTRACGSHRYVASGGKAVRSPDARKGYVLAKSATSAATKLRAKGML